MFSREDELSLVSCDIDRSSFLREFLSDLSSPVDFDPDEEDVDLLLLLFFLLPSIALVSGPKVPFANSSIVI